MKELAVYLHNFLAGHLWLDENRLFTFQYAGKYLNNPDATALSLSIPLRENPYRDDSVRPFFSNLLPEGEIRVLIAKIKQISEKNDFKMLEAIGGECAGAVSIMPPGKDLGIKGGYTVLSDNEIEAAVEGGGRLGSEVKETAADTGLRRTFESFAAGQKHEIDMGLTFQFESGA